MVREWYGYLLIIFLFFFSLVWIVVGVIRKHRSDVFGTSDNRRSSSFDSLHSLYRENTRQKELERLERKLFAVQKRLENRQQQQNSISKFGASQLSIFSSTNITSLPLLIDHYGNIDYDAGPLFDVLNTDNNEQLSYGELQCALELNVEQIEIFARRMNQLAGNDSGTRSVCRSAFESHFLQVLGELSYFEPTTSEVEELFDELAHGEDWASYDTFFGSILPTFLTYPQIKELIAEFRKCDAFIDHMDTKQTRKCKSVPHFAAIQDMAARISNTLFFTFKRSSKPRLRFQLDPQAHSRWFRMESFLAARKVKQCIHREVFCTYYTELLTRVTKDALLESHEKHITQKYEGVDLAFQNLSLELTMGSKKVNVVNQVSGRLPAHTMTALMGGSGKCE